MMKYCTKCGSPNVDNALFCTHCGAQLPMIGIPSAPQQNVPPSTTPLHGQINQPGGIGDQSAPQTTRSQQAGTPSTPSWPPSGIQNETILFVHAGAVLASIDGKRVSIPPHSGTVMITDKRFIFLSRGKGGVVATSLLGGGLTYGLISRATTKVDLEEINDFLRRPGSFSLELRKIKSINAEPSGMLHTGKLQVDFDELVSPNETNVSGAFVLFAFMGRGSPGGTILKKEEASYLNNNLNMIIRSQK